MSALRLGRRPWLAVGVVLVTASALVWYRATDAQAAVSSVDASPETAVNQLPGDTTHTINATVTRSAPTDSTAVRFVITDGPNANLGNNGTFESDGTCEPTLPIVVNGTATCTYTARDYDTTTSGVQAVPGTDTIQVFGDNDGDSILDPGEPTDTVSKTWAGPPARVEITPASDSASVGTCNAFTVTSTDEAGRPNPGVVLDIQAEQPIGIAAFCDPDGSGPAVRPSDDNAAPNVAHSQVTTPANGAGVTFGIDSTEVTTTSVTAWIDANNNNVWETNSEPGTAATKTWTPGGTDAVSTLDAQPETATPTVGTAHTISATLRNAEGDTVRGVTPTADVTAGPNEQVAVSCQTSNNDGVATCSYTGSSAGEDTIVVWVNQSDGGTQGPDEGKEPIDTVTATWTTSSPSPSPSPSESASPSPSPSQSPNPASSVSLTVSPTARITAGNRPALSGVVRNAQGQPIPNENVTLYKKEWGQSSYTPVANLTTDSEGRFSTLVQPHRQTAYGANSGDARSPVRTIFVHTRVNIDSPTPATGGRARAVANPVTFQGSLLPQFANVAVGLGRYFPETNRWVVLTQTRTDGAGRYVITRSLDRGTGVYVIFTSAHDGSDKGSKSIKLYVS